VLYDLESSVYDVMSDGFGTDVHSDWSFRRHVSFGTGYTRIDLVFGKFAIAEIEAIMYKH
jgi:hypothetical protein